LLSQPQAGSLPNRNQVVHGNKFALLSRHCLAGVELKAGFHFVSRPETIIMMCRFIGISASSLMVALFVGAKISAQEMVNPWWCRNAGLIGS